MLEWYRVGDTLEDQMQLVQDLVVGVLSEARSDTPSRPEPAVPFTRTTYAAAFLRQIGADVLRMTGAELQSLAQRLGISAPESLRESDRDGWLNLILVECIEPHLGRGRAEFLFDYPATQAALARIRPGNPPVAERFELYLDGIELCNGYRELTDPAELRRRMAVESDRRSEAGHAPLAPSNRLIQAMEAGLPDCAGVALGFDRLLMMATGDRSIDQVIAFPFDRA